MKKAGWIISGLLLAFLLPASVAPKLLGMDVASNTMVELGWPAGGIFALGVLELVLLLMYAWPRTAIFGAVLFTALLGGAVATHLRVGSPLATHTLFGVYFGILLWLGLYMRDPALRAYVQASLRR